MPNCGWVSQQHCEPNFVDGPESVQLDDDISDVQALLCSGSFSNNCQVEMNAGTTEDCCGNQLDVQSDLDGDAHVRHCTPCHVEGWQRHMHVSHKHTHVHYRTPSPSPSPRHHCTEYDTMAVVPDTGSACAAHCQLQCCTKKQERTAHGHRCTKRVCRVACDVLACPLVLLSSQHALMAMSQKPPNFCHAATTFCNSASLCFHFPGYCQQESSSNQGPEAGCCHVRQAQAAPTACSS